MTARRATASIIVIAAIAALAGCSDPEPTADDYRDTHVAFWTIGAEVAEKELGVVPRDDLERYLIAEWALADKRSTWTPVYDSVCEELKEGGEPDLILELVEQLQKGGIPSDAAFPATMDQVDAIVENLCPSQAGAAEAVRADIVKD